ncbi:hypothetical protein C0995_005653 [Termitomyces sp. Mi166|nr:hypothetical protein C0995_005653 [Termitomyces sp. Mi166\
MSDNVVWYQPTYGSTYHPGQQIPVSYKSSQSSCDASFRLCTSNALSAPQRRTEDSGLARRGCGTSTWPMFTRQKNGTCTAMLDPPPVEKEQTFVLQMETKSGSVWESPYFTLTPSKKMSAPSAVEDNSPDTFPAPSNFGTSESAPYFSPKSNSFMGDQIYLPASHTSTNTSSPHANNATLSARDATPDSSAFMPNAFLNTSNPLAVAIPLGFVLCIAIVAVVLAVHHYRKRVQKRTTDAEKLATLSRFSSRDSMYKDPLEYPANAALPAHVSGPVPLFMPVDLDISPAQEKRRATRKSVPVSASYTNVPTPAGESTQVIRGSRPLIVSRGSVETSEADASGENERGSRK